MPTKSSTEHYNTLNNQIWGEGGTKQEGYQQQVDEQKQSGGAATPYDEETYRRQLEAAGIDPNKMYEYSQNGGYTQDRNIAISGGGTGQPVDNFYREGTWYYYPGQARPVQSGTSGMDEAQLSNAFYEYVQYCKEEYNKAKAAGDTEGMAYWHNEAEKVRARSGYSGGTDGSMSIPLSQLQQAQLEMQNSATSGAYGGASGTGTITYPDTPEGRMQAYLDEWKAAAMQQANGQVDYAVNQAVRELERALADAQPQFKEQAESVTLDERQAMDNAALYAQLRGDKGGIGQEQYSSIQNTAAQNRLAVQQAQTKLSTDTARQIEDLRAQGEFEKADKALEITQNYLAQLVALEQWAAEYGLTQQQFQASLQQWEAEYNMALQQIGIAQNQWQQEFDAAQNQWQQEFQFAKDQFNYEVGQNATNQLAQAGYALLESGQIDQITDAQLQAMGFSRDQAQAYYDAFVAASTSNGTTGATDAVYQMLIENNYTNKSDVETIKKFLRTQYPDWKDAVIEAYADMFVASKYTQLHLNSVVPSDNSWGPGMNTTTSDGKASDWAVAQGKIRDFIESENLVGLFDYLSKNQNVFNGEQWKWIVSVGEEKGVW